MVRPRSRIASLAIVLLLLLAGAAQGLTLLTEENPPFNYTDKGKLVGSGTEIIVEMLKRARLDAKLEVLPWEQAYIRTQGERDVCLFSTARLENREKLFAWVGPIAINAWAVYGRGDFNAPAKTLNDLKPYRIGGTVNDAKVEFLRENNLTNVRAINDDRQNPARLLLPADNPDHIDLWIAGVYSARDLAKAAKVGDLKQVLLVRELPLYLACSPQTGAATIKALSDALDALRADGTQKRITADYEKRFPQ